MLKIIIFSLLAIFGGLVIWVVTGHYENLPLSWRHRLGRFCDNLMRFLPDKYLLCRSQGGKIYLNLREPVITLQIVCYGYEPAKTNVIRTYLQPGMTFLDAGANKGYFTLLAAKLVGIQGQVLAFEPHPGNVQWLSRSIESNPYQNIQVHEMALGNTNSSTSLYLGRVQFQHTLIASRSSANSESLPVTQRTLDAFLTEHPVHRVDMLKIDVEGAELELLHGARQTLSTYHDIILLVDIHEDCVELATVYDFLRALGFAMYQMTPPHKELNDLVGIADFIAQRPCESLYGITTV